AASSRSATGSDAKALGQASLVSTVYPQSGNDWSVSNGDLGNGRFSSLDQINTSNVGKLKVAWAKSLDTPEMLGPHGAFGGIQSIPLEAGGGLYVQTPNGVDALDAPTRKGKGRFSGTAPPQQPCFAVGVFCIGSSANASRNIALGGGNVYVGEQDGSVVAVNQKTGAQVWQAQVAAVGTTAGTVRESNPWTVYADGVVLTSINGGDSPIQG